MIKIETRRPAEASYPSPSITSAPIPDQNLNFLIRHGHALVPSCVFSTVCLVGSRREGLSHCCTDLSLLFLAAHLAGAIWRYGSATGYIGSFNCLIWQITVRTMPSHSLIHTYGHLSGACADISLWTLLNRTL
jgi:hypothetical protein